MPKSTTWAYFLYCLRHWLSSFILGELSEPSIQGGATRGCAAPRIFFLILLLLATQRWSAQLFFSSRPKFAAKAVKWSSKIWSRPSLLTPRGLAGTLPISPPHHKQRKKEKCMWRERWRKCANLGAKTDKHFPEEEGKGKRLFRFFSFLFLFFNCTLDREKESDGRAHEEGLRFHHLRFF